MTREEAIEFMWLENHKNPVVIKWQHHKTIRDLVEKLIDKIYNDFEEESFDDVTFVWNESNNFI